MPANDPWIVRKARTAGKQTNLVCDQEGATLGMFDAGENARRVVACVNACRGLSTAELEQHGLVSAGGAELAELERQRDDADRRAGAAERRLASAIESSTRRESWLRKAKREWGVDDSVSFDVVWAAALALKAEHERRGDFG